MSRIEKDFSDLDIHKVDFHKKAGGGFWTSGSGGHPLQDGERYISFVEDNDEMQETRYKLPNCINEMINLERKSAAEEVKREIKRAIGI